MSRSNVSRALASSLLLVSLCGCRVDWSERTTGAVIGGAGGAVAGGLLGSAVGSTWGGAALGAAAGAAAGYIIGDYIADRRERSCSDGCESAAAPAAGGAYGEPGSRGDAAPDASTPTDLGPVMPAPAEAATSIRPATSSKTPPAMGFDRDSVARREYEAGRLSKTDAEALGHYNAAMRAMPSRPEPHNARGLVLLHMGRREDARRAFQQAVLVDSSYEPARANLERITATAGK